MAHLTNLDPCARWTAELAVSANRVLREIHPATAFRKLLALEDLRPPHRAPVRPMMIVARILTATHAAIAEKLSHLISGRCARLVGAELKGAAVL